MATLKRCDKCQNEIGLHDVWNRGYVKTSPITSFDLCGKCSNMIARWIRYGELPDVTLMEKSK